MGARIRIAQHPIGDGAPCFVIAEAGINHNGDVALAHRLIDVAVRAGADAVKFQTFRAAQVISPAAPKAAYQKRNTGGDESQLEMARRWEFGESEFRALQRHCAESGILFLSTPFDHDSVDLLARLDVAAFKVASGEVTNLPLLRHIATTGRPVILSTGMSWLGEVDAAVRALREAGCGALALLHCVSNYPAAPADANLRAMATMARAFAVPVGYSDHTLGLEVALAAVALGAAIVEKHFTLDRSLPGPDHKASLTPDELAALVSGIRAVEAALGDGVKAPREAEADTRRVARRSLFLVRDVAAGAALDEHDLIALRPSGGIDPAETDRLVGAVARRKLAAGEMLGWNDVVLAAPAEPMAAAARERVRA